ncbi:MAG TPA: PHP domain-containing protein, partial [Thermoanaerobaculia bacterium]
MSGRKTTRDLDALAITHNPPGAQKEKVKERAGTVPLSGEYDHLSYVEHVLSPKKPKGPEVTKRKGRTGGRPYAELRAATSFSFLNGASLPEDLIHHAAQHDLPAMAVVDINGVYGAPRFHSAAKKAGIKALIGAELKLDDGAAATAPALREASWRPGLASPPRRLTLLVENRTGYKNLCRLLTAGALAHPKGEARYTWKLIEQ